MVLIDGVIVNSPTTVSYDFSNLMTDNIDRIEILRGAQSMLYGSDAIGGVINIYTKKGTDASTSNAFMEYGSFAVDPGRCCRCPVPKGSLTSPPRYPAGTPAVFLRSIIAVELMNEMDFIIGKVRASSAYHLPT